MNKTFINLQNLAEAMYLNYVSREDFAEIINHFSLSVYYKPRAQAFRRFYIETAMRFYDNASALLNRRKKVKK